MLADFDQFCQALDVNNSPQELGLHSKAKRVELYHDPKAIIDKVVRQTYPDKPQHWGRSKGQLYADLAPMIRLSRLKEVPAYQQFVSELTSTLKAINIIY